MRGKESRKLTRCHGRTAARAQLIKLSLHRTRVLWQGSRAKPNLTAILAGALRRGFYVGSLSILAVMMVGTVPCASSVKLRYC